VQRVRGRDDVELACGFLEHVRGRVADPDEVTLLRQAVVAGRLAEAEQQGAAPLPIGARGVPASPTTAEPIEGSGPAALEEAG
jgi:hypothetical protein